MTPLNNHTLFTHPTSQDWLEIFLDHGYKYVWESLMAITSMLPVDYLNVDEAIEGVAAAAVIAAALNHPLPDTPPEILAWLPAHPSATTRNWCKWPKKPSPAS
ncbi:MAG: DUF4259 domain-containing protein [Chloroflexi bacterium]|nr:DUF4259 domain-containing protein [Chloroflexota bacterium]